MGGAKHLNIWNLFYIFIPGMATFCVAVLTAIFIFLRLKVGATHLSCFCPVLARKRKDLALFLRTASGGNKILITVEVFICILGYVVFYAVAGGLYVFYYLFEINGTASKHSPYFIKTLIMQPLWELALASIVNGYLRMKMSRHCLTGDLEDSYSKLDNEPEQANEDELSFEFFLQKRIMQQLEFFIVGGEQQEQFQDCLEIKKHLPELFEEIRTIHNLDYGRYCQEFVNISKQFNESLEKQLLTGSGGASGAIFCPTISKRYYIKKLEQEEVIVLLNILPQLRSLWKGWPNSLINRIFGLYSVKIMSRQVWFQVMDYLFFDMPEKEPTEKYDLKGSEFKREVGSNPLAGRVMKDKDFTQQVLLPKNVKDELARRLTMDIHFLANQNIMDYSLLVGVKYEEMPEVEKELPDLDYRQFKKMPCGKTRQLTMYSFGIIDYLQKWNRQKWMESTAKHSLLQCWAWFRQKPKPEISAVASNIYQARFRKNVLGKLFGEDYEAIVEKGLSQRPKQSLSVNISGASLMQESSESNDEKVHKMTTWDG